MNHAYIIFFVLLFSTHRGISYKDNRPRSYWDQCKQKLNEFKYSFASLKNPTLIFGNQDPSAKLKYEIRLILRRIGLNNIDSIHIKYFSDYAIETMGEKNAFVYHLPGGTRYLFVSKSWFKSLSPEVRQFIIAHEGMHLKCNHTLKCLISLCVYIICAKYITRLCIYKLVNIYYTFSKKTNLYAECIIALGINAVELNISLIFLYALSRMHEFEADREAVIALNSVQGGIALFDMLQALDNHPKAKKTILRMFLDRLKKLYNTHPTHMERKNALLSIKM